MIIKAQAKLNLAIDVLGRRENGYHLVDLISVPLNLHDSIEITETSAKHDTYITSDDLSLALDESNTVDIAFKLMKEEFKFKKSYRIEIYKSIPTLAGLAGGSSDAACLMRCMAKENKLGVDLSTLMTLGLRIGADVPFCLYNAPARVRGIGEIVEPITTKLACHVLIVKPRQGLSTKEVYDLYDQVPGPKADIPGLIAALQEDASIEKITPFLHNSLRLAATKLCPVIDEILRDMRELGLPASEMSGSGSSCFALSKDEKKLEKVAKHFTKRGHQVIITSIGPFLKR